MMFLLRIRLTIYLNLEYLLKTMILAFIWKGDVSITSLLFVYAGSRELS